MLTTRLRSSVLLAIALAALLSACGSDGSTPGAGTVTITCADVQAQGTATACNGSAPASTFAIGDPPMLGGTVSAATGAASIATTLHATAPISVITFYAYDTSCDGSLTPGIWVLGDQAGPLPAGDTPINLSASCQGIPGTRMLYAATYTQDTTIRVTGTLNEWVPGDDPSHLLDQASVQFTMTQ